MVCGSCHAMQSAALTGLWIARSVYTCPEGFARRDLGGFCQIVSDCRGAACCAPFKEQINLCRGRASARPFLFSSQNQRAPNLSGPFLLASFISHSALVARRNNRTAKVARRPPSGIPIPKFEQDFCLTHTST